MGGLQGQRVTAQVFCGLETTIATKFVLKACLATHSPPSLLFVLYQLRLVVSLEGLEKPYIRPLFSALPFFLNVSVLLFVPSPSFFPFTFEQE